MSNLPNKEQLLARIRPILGVNPGDEDLTAEEIKQKTIEQLEAQQKAQAQMAEVEQRRITLELDKMEAENQKTRAETQKIVRLADLDRDRLQLDKGKLELDSFKTGYEMQAKADQAKTKEYEGYQRKMNQGGG